MVNRASFHKSFLKKLQRSGAKLLIIWKSTKKIEKKVIFFAQKAVQSIGMLILPLQIWRIDNAEL